MTEQKQNEIPVSVHGKKLCFVLIPFGDDEKPEEPWSKLPWDDFFKDIIKEVIEDTGIYICDRALCEVGDIFDRGILDKLFKADLIIAVLTSDLGQTEKVTGRYHPNPNVMYELGVAHALGQREIILLIDSKPGEKAPFDIETQNIIPYGDEKIIPYGNENYDKRRVKDALKKKLRPALLDVERFSAVGFVKNRIQAKLRTLPSREKLVLLTSGKGDMMKQTAENPQILEKDRKSENELKELAKYVLEDIQTKPKCLLNLIKGEEDRNTLTVFEQEIAMFKGAGFNTSDIIVVAGYNANALLSALDNRIKYVHNKDWEDQEILGSLLCALEQYEEELEDGFVVAYTDLVFQNAEDLKKLYEQEELKPISFLVHKKAKALKQRYDDGRESVHPWDREAEIVVIGKSGKERDKLKKIGKAPRVNDKLEREYGEFVGVIRFTRHGVSILKNYLQGKREQYKKQYLTSLLQEIIDKGQTDILDPIDIEQGYWEIDTLKDLWRASRWIQKQSQRLIASDN